MRPTPAVRQRAAVRLLVVTMLIVVAAYAGHRLARWRTDASAAVKRETPLVIHGLTVPAESLAVGEVWEGKDVRFVVPIHNTSSAPVEVLDFGVSCDCMSVTPRCMTIPAGGIGEVVAVVDLATRRTRAERGASVRPFAVELKPVFKTQNPRRGWLIEGVARSRVTADVTHVHFGESLVRGKPGVTRQVPVTVHVPTQRLEVHAELPLVDAEVRPAGDGRYVLRLTARTDKIVGAFSTTVSVRPVDDQGHVLNGVDVAVEGVVRLPEAATAGDDS